MNAPRLRFFLFAALLAALLATNAAASDNDVAELRAMLEDMRVEYEQRIEQLEARLATAERRAREEARRAAERRAEPRPMTAPPAAGSERVGRASTAGSGSFEALTSGAAFNPQISVILDGNYYQDDADGDGAVLVGEAFQPSRPGHGHDHDGGGHAHGVAEDGFNFREAEISFTATVGPYFDAATYLAIDGDGTLDLEEAYLQTRALPAGLRLKAGKFLSDFGYANKQHPHQWDFVDQNLPYLNLLGSHGLQDTGVQLTWLPELPVYTLLGVELAQGDQELFGATIDDEEQAELNLGDTESGPRLWTAFAKLAPDIGRNQALQFGVSYAHNRQHQEVHAHDHGHDHDEHEHDDNGNDHDHDHDHGHDHDHEPDLHRAGLAGDADLWGLDLVYKYDGGGSYGRGDFKFQSEYLRSIKDLSVRYSDHPEQIGSQRKFTTDGLYAQATYGIAPRWKAGLRYDVLGLTNKVTGGKDDSFGSSDRWTLDLTWNLTEFSTLRAQYAYNDLLVSPDERERFNAFYLQFLVSMGSHGAHAF